MAEYVYVMKGLTKVVPPSREILSRTSGCRSSPVREDRGAWGPTALVSRHCCGSWRASTTEFEGEAWPASRASPWGICRRNPTLDPDSSTVREQRASTGLGEVASGSLDRFNELSAEDGRAARRRRDGQRVLRPQFARGVRTRSTLPGRGTWTVRMDIAMDALRVPNRDDADVTTLSGGERRRVALCRLLLSQARTCCCSTSRPTTLDAQSVAWLRAPPRRLPRGRSWRSPTTATSSTTSPSWILELDRGKGTPVRGQLLRRGWSRSQARLRAGGARRVQRPRQRTLARRARVGARVAQARPSGKERRRASQSYEALLAQVARPSGSVASRAGHDPQRGSGSATWSSTPTDVAQGLTGTGCSYEDMTFSAAAGRHRRRSSVPTARARRRCSA